MAFIKSICCAAVIGLALAGSSQEASAAKKMSKPGRQIDNKVRFVERPVAHLTGRVNSRAAKFYAYVTLTGL